MKRISLTCLTLLMLSPAPMLHAQGAIEGPSGAGGPKVNRSVFQDDAIRAVTAVTEVFGDGQKVTAAVVELAEPVSADSVGIGSFTVEERNILSVRVADTADPAAPAASGRFIVIALDPADAAAPVFGPDLDKAAALIVKMAGPLTFASGAQVDPGMLGVINTRTTNVIVDDFRQFRFTDPETGLTLDYNLYIPKNYDPGQSYPLVLFMHDAGVTGSNPRRTLQQGLGAVSFARPEDQARHPAFVLAPQFPVPLTNDASQTSVYVDLVPRLLAQLAKDYSIDRNRLYTTGQSGGCMTSIALGIAEPDLFAATLCVAGQWDASLVAPLAGAKFWAIVSEDDSKAFPGMTAIMEELAANGAKIARGQLDAKAPAQDMAQAVAAIRASGTDSNVFFTTFTAGSVLDPSAPASPGAGHVNTWHHAYTIPALRDWLFEQRK
ncbi:hypothetical protein [Tropicimonas sp.]|uniref:hypothetical protein n=1 Tax=Tropicimonas sp. TaxID=2067044 RepID=UPI003A887F12